MNKAWMMATGCMALLGCGSSEPYYYSFPAGVYAGVVGLVAGATPACSLVADPNVDACCDDTQAVALSVSLYSDGYYVDAWPASIDAAGRLLWQESFNGADNGCINTGSSNEALSQSYLYTFAATTTQTCGASAQTVQCAYRGQLILQ